MKACTSTSLVLMCLLLNLCVGSATAQKPVGFDRSTLSIETTMGRHDFKVELARTPDQLAFGLMFRAKLAPDAGMLFDYGKPQLVAMWMKNTLIPLDMLFIDGSGQIVTIAERTVPHSLKSISSKAPVRAVLEVNGGTVSRLKIKRGDIVLHPIFKDN